MYNIKWTNGVKEVYIEKIQIKYAPEDPIRFR